MVGRSGHKQLDRLIDEVARGQRPLTSIRNPELREAVRIALRLHADAPSVPDAYIKARMRARVMARLDPRPRSLRDTAWTFLELLARPAPFIVRGVALGSLVLCVALAGFVASADTLPDDALYPVKTAAEQIRLALAAAPADRAAVELSIAEHRLGEAERLAATGRTSDALVASAFYSEHIASAAAELAPTDDGDLSAQLESHFSAQRERALALAATLATDERAERASAVLVMIATSPLAPGTTQVERVAESAVTLAADLANAAEEASEPRTTVTGTEATRIDPARPAESARDLKTAAATSRAPATRAVEAARPTLSEQPRVGSQSASRPTLHPTTTRDPRASEAAKAAREAAEKARAAADKVKNAVKHKGSAEHR